MRQIRPRTSSTAVRPGSDRLSFSMDLRDRPTDSAASDEKGQQEKSTAEAIIVDPDDRSVVPWGFFEDDET